MRLEAISDQLSLMTKKYYSALDNQTVWYGCFSGALSYHGYYIIVLSVSKRNISQSSHRNSSVYTVPLGDCISSSQLPFDILLLTCMFVLMQKCSSIPSTLWNKVIMTNTYHHLLLLTMTGWSGIAILFIFPINKLGK